jgi:hypothetical protein
MRPRLRFALLVPALVLLFVPILSGCGASQGGPHGHLPPMARTVATRPLPTLVLVTLDGVRANDIFSAPLPHLRALMERGVALGAAGAPMVASGPRFVSLPGYREILTGRRNTRCADNRCPAIDEPTLLDQLRDEGGLDPSEIAVVSSWEVIARAAASEPDALLMSVGRHGGELRHQPSTSDAMRLDLAAAARVPASPGTGDYRPDRWTARLALDLVAARHPRALWVALGDTDEYAHRGDYDGYLRALAADDEFLGQLVDTLDLDHTLVIVTADHGRSANFRDHGDSPESSAVWLVAAGGPIARVGRVRTDGVRRLADIAPTVRALLHLSGDDSPQAGHVIPELLAPATLAD